ncbi:MAG: DUF4260 family protein [Actinobacteria bacterium]|nr:MAG: DUF4260 family protein [Actinomycetota bacterium]
MLLPGRLLRLEGLALFAGALIVYFDQGFGWLLLVVLVLVPDLSFAGYLAGPRAGSWIYNAAHTTLGPIALGAVGVLSNTDWCIQLALIWLAHIGLDRLLGYGLKYPTAFKDTHLSRV